MLKIFHADGATLRDVRIKYNVNVLGELSRHLLSKHEVLIPLLRALFLILGFERGLLVR